MGLGHRLIKPYPTLADDNSGVCEINLGAFVVAHAAAPGVLDITERLLDTVPVLRKMLVEPG